MAEKKKYLIGVYEVWEQMHEVEAESFDEACDLIVQNESTILSDQFEFVEFDENPFHLYEK